MQILLKESDGVSVGKEWQGENGAGAVNVIKPLPAGTNVIGHVIVDSGGGGGIQYTEGDTDSSLAGTVALAEGPLDTATPLQVDASKHLQVDLAASSATVTVDGSGVTQPVSGTVTAIQSTATNLKVDASGVAVPVTDNSSTLSIDDGAGSITVDGTVSITEPVSVDDNAGSLTVDNSTLAVVGGGLEATAMRVTLASDSTGVVSVDDNASTLSIDDGAGSITVDGTVSVSEPVSVDDNGGSLTVDNATISVVGSGTEATAQRVTIATDSTGVVSVDDNGGALTVDGTVAVSSLGGTVAVTQSGTWDEVGINDSGNVITVDGSGSAGTAAAGVVTVQGIASMTALLVNNPTATNLKVDASGVAIPVTDNSGALTVDWAGTAPPIGAGLEATALRVTVATDSTGVLSVDDNGGSLTVDNATISVVGSGTEATAQRVTIATDSTGVLSVDDNGASLTIDNAQLSVVGSGTEATALRVTVATDSTGVLSVDDNGGALTVDGSVTANAGTNLNTSALALEAGGNLAGAATSLSVLDDWDNTASDGASVSGDVAHDSPDAGEPAKIGGQARTTNPIAVADSDRANAIFDDLGRQVVLLNHVRDLVTQNTGSLTDTTETTILAAGAAGVFHDLTSLDLTNASSTAVRVDIRDTTGGTVQMSYNLAANGGVAKVFMSPWKQTTAALNWTAQLSAGSITVHWNIQAVKNV